MDRSSFVQVILLAALNTKQSKIACKGAYNLHVLQWVNCHAYKDLEKLQNALSILCIECRISNEASLDHIKFSFCEPGGHFKNTYELLNLRALKFSPVDKIHIFQCMGEIFCVEFQRYPLKFHTKYLTCTLKVTIFIQHWNSKSS